MINKRINWICKVFGHKLYYYEGVGPCYQNCSRCGKNIIDKIDRKKYKKEIEE